MWAERKSTARMLDSQSDSQPVKTLGATQCGYDVGKKVADCNPRIAPDTNGEELIGRSIETNFPIGF